MERVLGVAIGLTAVCLLLSIIASHVQEVVAAFTARRAATLEEALGKMLQDDDLLKKFLDHPLIQNISFGPSKFLNLGFLAADKARPSYIASPLFSRVLLNMLAVQHDLQATDVHALVKDLPDSALKQRLQTLMVGTQDNAEACNAAIEQWYDSTMERLNGYYKRQTQWVLMAIGLALAILCNANLFQITSTLWISKDARETTEALSKVYACRPGEPCTVPAYEQARRDLDKLNPLPLGYQKAEVRKYWYGISRHVATQDAAFWGDLGSGIYTLCGWLLTAVAVSLGAPFWFDLLNQFINLRITGSKPQTAAGMKAEASGAGKK